MGTEVNKMKGQQGKGETRTAKRFAVKQRTAKRVRAVRSAVVVLICIAMVLSLIPVAALAQNDSVPPCGHVCGEECANGCIHDPAACEICSPVPVPAPEPVICEVCGQDVLVCGGIHEEAPGLCGVCGQDISVCGGVHEEAPAGAKLAVHTVNFYKTNDITAPPIYTASVEDGSGISEQDLEAAEQALALEEGQELGAWLNAGDNSVYAGVITNAGATDVAAVFDFYPQTVSAEQKEEPEKTGNGQDGAKPPAADNALQDENMPIAEQEDALKSIDINPSGAQIVMGYDKSFTVTVSPAGANVQSIEWSSEDTNIAAVTSGADSATATVNGVGEGSTRVNVTVTDAYGNTKTDSAIVDVEAASYKLTYYSNYPANAKKLVYDNGKGTNQLLPATQTQASYSYAPDAVVNVIGGFALANYDFQYWARDAAGNQPVNPGDEITMDTNVQLYAIWGEEKQIENRVLPVQYIYVDGNQNNSKIKNTQAIVDREKKTATFVLATNQDVLFRPYDLIGWKVSAESEEVFAFNQTVTFPISDIGGVEGVNVYAALAGGTLNDNAQFFVLKENHSPIGMARNFYSLGAGTIDIQAVNAEMGKTGANAIWGSGTRGDESGDVSRYITSSPDPARIADMLNISVAEASSIRWYVVIDLRNKSDGYHVDGILYETNKYHNVLFYDLDENGEYQQVKKLVVRDSGQLSKGDYPAVADGSTFQYWYDGANSEDVSGGIEHIFRDYNIYAKHTDILSVTGQIDNGTVNGSAKNYGQSVNQGNSSAAMEFVEDKDRVIKAIWQTTGGGAPKDITGDNAGETTYTYPAQTNVTQNISIYVETEEKAAANLSVDIAIGSYSKTYGDDDPAFGAKVTAPEGSGADAALIGQVQAYLQGNGALAREAGEDVKDGGYAVTVADETALRAAFPDVTFSISPGTLTIGKKALTIKVDDKTINYGEDKPELTFAYDGYVRGDSFADLDSPGTASTNYEKGDAAGKYAIDVTAGSDNNYTLPGGKGTLKVSPISIDLTGARVKDAEKTYGENDPAYELEGWPDGYDIDDFNIAFTREKADLPNYAGEDVGEYGISASITPKTGNYTVNGTVEKGTLTIGKRTLTVTGTDLYLELDAPKPDAATLNGLFTYDNFAFGQTAAVLNLDDAATTYAGSGYDAKGYPVTRSEAPEGNKNYIVPKGSATIHINSRAIDLAGLEVKASKVFGDADPAARLGAGAYELVNWPENVPQDAFDITIEPRGGVDGSYNSALEDVGIHDVTVKAETKAGSGYTVEGTPRGALEITKKSLTAKVDDQQVSFGEDAPELTYGYDSFAFGQTAAALDGGVFTPGTIGT